MHAAAAPPLPPSGVAPFSVVRTHAPTASPATAARVASRVAASRASVSASSSPRRSSPPGTSAPAAAAPLRLRPLTVLVRKRPLNASETAAGDCDCIGVSRARRVVVHVPTTRFDLRESVVTHAFDVDRAYDERAATDDVYADAVAPLVARLAGGVVGTVFAYGQTGSGKSFTMGGLLDRAVTDVFEAARAAGAAVVASYFEIYCSKVFDLLNARAALVVREDEVHNVNVCGLTEHAPATPGALLGLIRSGADARAVGTTRVNAASSRSHAVLTL